MERRLAQGQALFPSFLDDEKLNSTLNKRDASRLLTLLVVMCAEANKDPKWEAEALSLKTQTRRFLSAVIRDQSHSNLISDIISGLCGLEISLCVALWSFLFFEDTSLKAGNVIVKTLQEYHIHKKDRAEFSTVKLVAGLMVEYIYRNPQEDVKELSCLH